MKIWRSGNLVNGLLLLVAVVSPLLVFGLSYSYSVPNRLTGFFSFLYEEETYSQFLTFLLSTTLIGSLGLLYSRIQKGVEIRNEILASKREILEKKVVCLSGIRDEIATSFQELKKTRRLFSTLTRIDGQMNIMPSDSFYGFLEVFQQLEIKFEDAQYQLDTSFEIEELNKLLAEPDYIDQVQMFNALFQEIRDLVTPIRSWLRQIEGSALFTSSRTRYDVKLPPFVLDFTSTASSEKSQFNEIQGRYMRILAIIARQVSSLDRLKEKFE